ncbi:hypothetical protein Pcinc_005259 [Petrolisthes cinctipes]|uniref:ADP-ribosylhydrolase ARH3 n=1 Tax=Petrolisthes cinctipes TaxID=88211 RepID=A0AAE1KZI1_PETCI|nr:hypothetical protein Pcinc_005259 [Petrolisthes cinctipes]
MSLTGTHRLLFVMGFLDLFGVSLILPLFLPVVKGLGVSHVTAGCVTSLYGAIQLFSSPVVGSCSDVVGRRRVLLGCLAATALSYMVLGASHSLLIVIVARCLAIREALHTPTNQLDVVKFIQSLKEMMKKVETLGEDEILEKGQIEFEYTGRLSRLVSLMERGDQVSIDAVEEELGNDISAHRSVPTAIYSFLKASNTIPNIEAETAFMRTIHYAISLGGDTDTIASMAGSIAGAFYGIAEIPESLQRHCEGLAEAIQQADQLHSLATNTHPPPS